MDILVCFNRDRDFLYVVTAQIASIINFVHSMLIPYYADRHSSYILVGCLCLEQQEEKKQFELLKTTRVQGKRLQMFGSPANHLILNFIRSTKLKTKRYAIQIFLS